MSNKHLFKCLGTPAKIIDIDLPTAKHKLIIDYRARNIILHTNIKENNIICNFQGNLDDNSMTMESYCFCQELISYKHRDKNGNLTNEPINFMFKDIIICDFCLDQLGETLTKQRIKFIKCTMEMAYKYLQNMKNKYKTF